MGRLRILHMVEVDWVTIKMVIEGILKGRWHNANIYYAVKALKIVYRH